MTSYAPIPDAVEMISLGGPVRLSHAQCDQLLGIFMEAGAVRDFNALADALEASGGVPTIRIGEAA